VALGALGNGSALAEVGARPRASGSQPVKSTVTLFLCGDVMLGRGIDQILEHPSDPVLHEPAIDSALGYVRLAERVSGELPRKVAPSYVWGDALGELEARHPDARIINLETSVTTSSEPWPKGINYRMHPRNVGAITAARVDICSLANNHVLDWEEAGLIETLATLSRAHVATAGAGSTLSAARAPAIKHLTPSEGAKERRVLVFAAATDDSGVPGSWAATAEAPGVHRLRDLSNETALDVARDVRHYARSGDIVVFSVHWGGNWGYGVSADKREFAHRLIDEAGVHIIHGHSSHHVRPVEVHNGGLILYGCGDFINDYEGIGGHEEYRDDLGLMYFPTLDAESGRLLELVLVPTRIWRFRVNRASGDDRAWMLETLRRESGRYGCGVEERAGELVLTR
jgi:poly-gamma-glutamate synthesis protein (capsule biosynthesis protein)